MENNIRRAQKVEIYGEHVGYQFSSTTMGHRAIQTTVRDIHTEVGRFGDKVERGLVNWNGRKNVIVERWVSNVWHTIPQSWSAQHES